MGKKTFKTFLKKFTLLDILIIIAIIIAIVFAFIHLTANDDNVESFSFDSSTGNKFWEKYLGFYREGKIVNAQIGGYNASSGEHQEIKGRVLWADNNPRILLDVNGVPMLAGFYTTVRNADFYIEHITLESDSSKYANVTDISVRPMNITNVNDIIEGVPRGLNFTVDTSISVSGEENIAFQTLDNALYYNAGKRLSITYPNELVKKLSFIMAGPKELDIANSILGSFDGESGMITFRIYNASQKDIETIKQNYHVDRIVKLS
ncbi:hypothetical protein [Methanobrevibacter filiformis]|uniref:Uncharacterized protein n=1 Tax=Methanobrevibacter filiformis TaxID=55758 RepID=A0A166A537_9EURY|nr:hypothetical protein [Methanobrevibacter filiformis]KZX11581.1 hypothetical protein MBFIL_13940 [Methanobrevibacter filiformis]